MDPPRADHPHDPSRADRTTFKAAEGGDLSVEGGGACRPPERGGVNRGREGIGAEPVWFEHSAYERAESSYQRWLADQEGARAPASGSSRGHGDGEPATGRCRRRGSTMSGVQYLAQERIWFDKSRYDEAERRFYEGVNGPSHASQTTMYAAGDQDELVTRMRGLELENQSLQNVVQDLRSALFNLESRVALLERTPAAASPFQTNSVQQPKVRAPVEEEEEEEDDDLDLFGSDEEDEEAERIREERLKAYAEKKAKKPALIAKSSILLDVKPWDDETDMVKLEECVRSVQADGLLWGSSKLVPVGYGIKKLQIQCVVEDDKVGTDMLEEEITKFEDYVQSVDVAAFNKI
ncbi:hypothetical protein ANANG_G00168670 [Anguilla anguilla]|uniref:Elongation factor 1-delta n=1 Tax=Anguilla anguilla TaxID=7936 RepID=A0A9D3M6E1_ANGAN|nr:hypothetical protein ANANG_G00168670 [Anguilla anguilla]